MRGYGSDKRLPKEPDLTIEEADIYVIVGLALGMTHDQVGAWVCTLDYPNGITGRTVRNWNERKQPVYDRIRMRIVEKFNQAKEEFRQITRDEVKQELEALRHKAVTVRSRVLDHALKNSSDTAALSLGDRAAADLLDRDLGKAAQFHMVAGEVNHNHRIWGVPQPAALLEAQERDMADSEDLLSKLPADLVDAEIVQ